jgi:hypothetical protein
MSTICTECDIEFSRKDGMEQLIRIHRAVMRIHHHHQRRNTHRVMKKNPITWHKPTNQQSLHILRSR